MAPPRSGPAASPPGGRRQRPGKAGSAAAAGLAPSPVIDETVLQQLVLAARAARERAYAPYSHFAVGAALLDEQGRIHAGCNIENAAYPQSQCAEASAIAHLVLAGGKRIMAAAVVGVAPQPVTPCGGCRQRLREFADDDMPIWVADLDSVRATTTLGHLLPASFGPDHLKDS